MSYSIPWQEETPLARSATDGLAAPTPILTDNQLVESVLSGDELAFEQIFDRHKRLSICVIGRYFRKPEEIEEVVQTVFAKVYFELTKFRGANALSLASWISRITSNTCVDIIRRQRSRPETLAYDMPDADTLMLELPDPHRSDSESQVIDRDLANKLLSRLEPTDRVLLEMLHVEGMSTSEAAHSIGWSESRVKMRAWRAKRALRKIVSELL